VVGFICLGTCTFKMWTMADMLLLHIHTPEYLFTASANISDPFQMSLVHMASVVIPLDNPRTSLPHTPNFLLVALHNGGTQLLVATG
jgi:hypothetical protein